MSSFSYLKSLPVDYLKIDGAFVRDIDEDQSNEAIVCAIGHLANAFNLKTIAEFVETQAIVEILRRLGVDFGQGFGLGRPEPLIKQLAARKAAA